MVLPYLNRVVVLEILLRVNYLLVVINYKSAKNPGPIGLIIGIKVTYNTKLALYSYASYLNSIDISNYYSNTREARLNKPLL